MPRLFKTGGFAVHALVVATGTLCACRGSVGGEVETSANRITQIVNHRFTEIWHERNLKVAGRADNATYHRRLKLDLNGMIPPAAEARRFAADDSAENRAALVARLMSNSAYTHRMATLLRQQWFPQTNVDPYRYLSHDVEQWIAEQLRIRVPLNQIARDLITVPYANHDQADDAGVKITVPRTLIEANDHRADQMANNVTTSFLGVNLACAQCHDHPSGYWSQDQFWQTAAYFQRATGDQPFSAAMLTIEIPGTDRSVTPVLFTGESIPVGKVARDGRDLIGQWIADPENGYFARQTVNRLWSELFGEPLVDSLEDADDSGELRGLLDEIASAFVASDFDYQALVSGLVLSDAYQLDSRIPDGGASDGRWIECFQVARVRGLSGSQVFDSLRISAGLPLLRKDIDEPRDLERRDRFRDLLGVDAGAGGKRSMVQALAMLNGELIRQLGEKNPTVEALAGSPFLSEEDCLDSLFWATLGRASTVEERERLREAGVFTDDTSTRGKRYARLYWMLINTVEFNTNH